MSRPALLGLWCLCQLCHLVAGVQSLIAIIIGSPRAWKIMVADDQLGNVVLGGAPGTMISAKAWMVRDKRRWEWLVCLLERIDPGHCERAWLAEVEKRDRFVEEHY